MTTGPERFALSVNEAACVIEAPLKKVRRIIHAGLLDGAVKDRKGARMISERALVGLRLAHETTGILTPEGRRRLVRQLLDDPEAKTVREEAVSVDVRLMKRHVKRRAAALEKARKMIVSDKDVLGGASCFGGTRIPVHDIAEMLGNGDDAAAIVAAYPTLTEERVAAARIYAEAYPRGRPRRQPAWRKLRKHASKEIAPDGLPRAT